MVKVFITRYIAQLVIGLCPIFMYIHNMHNIFIGLLKLTVVYCHLFQLTTVNVSVHSGNLYQTYALIHWMMFKGRFRIYGLGAEVCRGANFFIYTQGA